MRTDHIERFNKASAQYRADVERFITDCQSELVRAKAIHDTIKIAEALVVPEKATPVAEDRIERLRRTDTGRPAPKVVEISKVDADRIERELSASIEEVLSTG